MESKLFTPVTFGPLTLRNRTIRSAAFESMCPGNAPSDMLLDYHRSVAAGGIGMTTVAYAAVTQSGLSFDRQLWMRPEIIPGLRRLTDAIHAEGAAAGIQLGHCGNMSHKSICGCMPVGASSGFNLYSPTFVRGLRADELPEMARAYGRSVNLAREAGFDSVEIHAGHGYLISQFLSPSTNHRKDEFGGSLQNRMRFMDMVMEEVMKAAGSEAVLASENMVFSQHFCDEEAFNTCLHPFIRNAVGCMEFGGCFLNKRLNRNNDGGTTRRTTDIFQLATAILFQNPVQNFALAPNNLNDVSPVCMDFMKQVPVTWDETRFIEGYPGKYIVLARRHGDTWYVAAVNAGSEPLKLKFDLDMFAGKTVSLYKDDKRGEPQLIPLKVKEKGRVQLEVYPQGGIVLSDRIEET